MAKRRGSGRRYRELDEELDNHLELRADALVQEGLSRREARAEALRLLGDRRVLYFSASRRDSRLGRVAFVSGLGHDLIDGFRRAIREPMPTLLSVATFALGIGLTTAGFTLVDRVLIRALPFPESHRLVVLESVDSKGIAFPRSSAASWLQWKAHNTTLAHTALSSDEEWSVGTREGTIRVTGRKVTTDFFRVLGVSMLLGRSFSKRMGVPATGASWSANASGSARWARPGYPAS